MNYPKLVEKFRIKGEDGFTLTEVLIATIILTTGLLGMVALITGIMTGNKHSSNLTIATVLAQDKMEEVARKGYSNMPTSNITTTEVYGSITGYSLFKRETKTEVGSPFPDLKTITITVFWNSDDRSMALETVLAR